MWRGCNCAQMPVYDSVGHHNWLSSVRAFSKYGDNRKIVLNPLTMSSHKPRGPWPWPRYVTDLVSEARLVSSLARKRTMDAEDARLAAWMLQERTTACPPPRHVTSEVGHVSRVTWDVWWQCVCSWPCPRTAPRSRPLLRSPDSAFPRTDIVSRLLTSGHKTASVNLYRIDDLS